ncbi:ankyrin repeat-containing domain protein [Cladorrhinum sp. PSN259]|nr:ankyrin repeat-containing domain protein [Cladorrhinum sp. PSN259]
MLESMKEPCPGTMDWLLQHPRFNGWLNSTNPCVLNIIGKPGSGKSVLSAFLLQSGICQASSSTPFYFTFPETGDGRSAMSAWGSLIHQLLLEDPSLFPTVFLLLGRLRRNAPNLKVKLWTASRLKEVFRRLLVEFRRPSVYIIDALDQCDEVTRDTFFPDLVRFDLDEEDEHNKAIATAIQQKVGKLCRKWRSPHLHNDMTEQLSRAAQGMYLLPMMTIESLQKVNRTPANMERVLRQLPNDLLGAYRQVLNSIQEEYHQLAASVLLWVTCATRPLSIQELASAVALDHSIMSGRDLKMNTSTDILGSPGVSELVGPILKVSKRGRQFLVFLSHYSAREFLLGIVRYDDWTAETPDEDTEIYDTICEPPKQKRTPMYAVPQVTTTLHSINTPPLMWAFPGLEIDRQVPWCETYEAKLHKFALPAYLVRAASDDSSEDKAWRQLFDAAIKQFPALRYCIDNLPEHARLVYPFKITFHKSFAAFLSSRFGINWITSFWAVRDPGQVYGKQPPLHFASALGLTPEIKSLLASGGNVHARDQYGNTALDVATSTGDVDTIRLLHTMGEADIRDRQMMSIMPNDPASQNMANVLHTAAWYGHKEAIIYLLSAGSDPLVPDNDGLTALDIAVNSGNGPVVKVLMEEPSLREVVSVAARRGRVETLKWLAEEEQVDLLKFGTVALDVAVQHDQSACVRYLSATIPNGHGYVYRFAAKNGKMAVLKDMIASRAGIINSVDHEGRSALHHACLGGQIAVVPFLISAGIDTTLVDKSGYTALEVFVKAAAITCSNQEQVDIIMAFKDPQVRRRRTNGGNLLHLAFEFGCSNDRLIQTLLGRGLDPLERDSSGRTILHAAATGCSPMLPEVLNICDLPTAQDHLGQTPLHNALKCSFPSTEIVAALVMRMPDLGIQDHNGRTVVHQAMHYSDACDLVVERAQATSINVQDNEGMTPVAITVEELVRFGRSGEVVEFLRSYEAEREESVVVGNLGVENFRAQLASRT